MDYTDHNMCALDHSAKAYHELESEVERLQTATRRTFDHNQELRNEVERLRAKASGYLDLLAQHGVYSKWAADQHRQALEGSE